MRVPSLIIEIALLRRGPQALPASVSLMTASVIGYALSGLLVQLRVAPGQAPVPPILFDVALTAGLIGLALWSRGLMNRFVQTMAAVAGTGTLLTVCGLPAIELLESGPEGGSLAAVGALLWLALICWSLLVTAHILRHALDVSLSVGMLLAVSFLAASVLLYGLAFGSPE